MIRIYDNRLEKSFKLWHSIYHVHVRRDVLMKNCVAHYYKKNFELALMAFKTHASNNKKKERKGIIFEMEMQCDEQ